VAQSDGAAIDVDLVQIPAQFTGHRQRLGGKGLVGLDPIQLINLPAGLAQAALGSTDRAYAHDRRSDPGTGAGGDTGEYRQAQLSRCLGTHQHDRSGAVVETGSVARSDGAVVAERRPQLAQRLQDRKSTRLNSSHVRISYAVFCLKKKKKNADTIDTKSLQTQ